MKTVVLGCGDQGRVVWEILSLRGDVEILGFIDVCDNPDLWGKELLGLKILGGISDLAGLVGYERVGAVPAFGNNKIRSEIARRAEQAGLELVNAIHPMAIVSPNAALGRGVTVGPGAVINIHAAVGNNAIINSGAIVEHDCRIGDHAHVAPGAKLAGHVTVGEGALIGIGAAVIEDITIGDHATIGAGAVVIRDVAEGVTAVGVPAAPLAEPRGLPRAAAV